MKKGSEKQGGEHQQKQYKAEWESLGSRRQGRVGVRSSRYRGDVLISSSQSCDTRNNPIDAFSDHAKELKHRCCPTFR